MLMLPLVTCAALLASVSAQDSALQLGLLSGYEGVKRRLENYAEKLSLEERYKDIDLKYLTQRLDHFTPSVTDTWKQLYAENFEHYGGNNLIFLMIGGESSISTDWLRRSFMSKQAEKFKAATFTTEHRFYGKSIPRDLSIESLRYLSSEQALADLAHFITQMNIKHGFKNPKWIVFGGSYAGSLAAWLRYRYPHLVYAAVASSGPLLAKVDFHEYFETVSKSLSSLGSHKCEEAVRAANKIMSEGVLNATKRAHYHDLFDTCRPLEDNKNDISYFFLSLAIPIGSAAQYGDVGIIQNACEYMTDESIKCPVHRYAEFSKLIRGGQCLAHEFANLVAFLKDTNLGVLFGVRQWFYQTCTEFGWFFTSNRKNDLFGDKITTDFGDSICTDAYNRKFDTSFVERSVNETNLNYGGYNLPVTRVAFVHGMNDPWSPLGIMKKAPKGSVAITIKGVAHCADMMPDQDTDSQPLKNARARISRMLERWIKAKTSEDEELSLADF